MFARCVGDAYHFRTGGVAAWARAYVREHGRPASPAGEVCRADVLSWKGAVWVGCRLVSALCNAQDPATARRIRHATTQHEPTGAGPSCNDDAPGTLACLARAQSVLADMGEIIGKHSQLHEMLGALKGCGPEGVGAADIREHLDSALIITNGPSIKTASASPEESPDGSNSSLGCVPLYPIVEQTMYE